MNRQELIEHYRKKTYIGDSVYIHFDGYHFILETHNGLPNDPSNRIALEPDVIRRLLSHRDKVYSDFKELKQNEEQQGEQREA